MDNPRYYIQDDTGVIITLYSDIEMEEAWEALRSPEDASATALAKYGNTKVTGEMKLLKIIAKTKLKCVLTIK